MHSIHSREEAYQIALKAKEKSKWEPFKKIKNSRTIGENLISKLMVDKLKLTSIHRRTSYKVLWFKKGGEILVSQKYKIKFSIGRYEDEIYFIILHMDVCHLLLDRI